MEVERNRERSDEGEEETGSDEGIKVGSSFCSHSCLAAKEAALTIYCILMNRYRSFHSYRAIYICFYETLENFLKTSAPTRISWRKKMANVNSIPILSIQCRMINTNFRNRMAEYKKHPGTYNFQKRLMVFRCSLSPFSDPMKMLVIGKFTDSGGGEMGDGDQKMKISITRDKGAGENSK